MEVPLHGIVDHINLLIIPEITSVSLIIVCNKIQLLNEINQIQ